MAAWVFRTVRGPVYILPQQGRWAIVYDDENLGSYHSPQAAADDAAGGHTSTPSNGTDLADLAIPDDLGEWELI